MCRPWILAAIPSINFLLVSIFLFFKNVFINQYFGYIDHGTLKAKMSN